jgi:hypothetical protein
MANKNELLSFVDGKIKHYADTLTKLTREEQIGESSLNQHAMGELEFYCNLCVALEDGLSKDTTVATGILDGVNDLLQDVGLVKEGAMFFEEGAGNLNDKNEADFENWVIVTHIDKMLAEITKVTSGTDKSAKIRIFEQAKVRFLLGVKNCVNRVAYPWDVGIVDAVNDTLQFLGILPSNKKLYDL